MTHTSTVLEKNANHPKPSDSTPGKAKYFLSVSSKIKVTYYSH